MTGNNKGSGKSEHSLGVSELIYNWECDGLERDVLMLGSAHDLHIST